jgi:hypothetical protein
MKLFSKIIFLIFFVLTSKSYSCDLSGLNLGNDFDSIKLNEIQKSLISGDRIDNFQTKFIPIDILCENLNSMEIKLSLLNNEMFYIAYFNYDLKNQSLLNISKEIYNLDFKFQEDLKNLNYKYLQILEEKKNYFYHYDKINNLEILELINPSLNNQYRNLKIDNEFEH